MINKKILKHIHLHNKPNNPCDPPDLPIVTATNRSSTAHLMVAARLNED